MTATNNNVILKLIKVEETTKSGLIINSDNQTPIYEVISVGSNAAEEHIVDVGDYVFIRNTVGSIIDFDNTYTYKSVKWWEIEAIILKGDN